MATQKLQVGRALAVIPSDFANIPFPAVTVSSVATETFGSSEYIITQPEGFNLSTESGELFTAITLGPPYVPGSFYLTDVYVDFIALGVQAGDIVYNYGSMKAATVMQITNLHTLLLNVADVGVPGDDYILYNGENNNGCVLYIGTSGAIAVTTVGGDEVVFNSVVEGQFIPVQTIKLSATLTTAEDILALW